MSVEKQLESSAESPILFDGLPHLVEEGMEDVEERLLPEVVPPGVSRVTAQLLFPLVQSVTSPPAQSVSTGPVIFWSNSRDEQGVV